MRLREKVFSLPFYNKTTPKEGIHLLVTLQKTDSWKTFSFLLEKHNLLNNEARKCEELPLLHEHPDWDLRKNIFI